MVFMNTSVTRGTGDFVVTATGMATEMGKIAGMLRSVSRARSPLQKQMGDLTKKLSYVAYGALVLVVVLGLVRGQQFGELIFAGIAMAISAIPTGLPTFVQAMLSSGARRLADAKAIVRGLSDVETLGSTSAINTDKTGTLTLNQMTVRKLFYEGDWLTVEGGGYDLSGRIMGVAGVEVPETRRSGLHLVAGQRRHGQRRRHRGRRPDGGRSGRAGPQDRHRPGRVASRVPPAGGGALRFRLQVHGDVPSSAVAG